MDRGGKLAALMCVGCHEDPATHRLTGECLGDLPAAVGEVYSPNITQHPTRGIGGWIDGEIACLLRTGVTRDGRYLPPWMIKLPHLSDESPIAYLRSDASAGAWSISGTRGGYPGKSRNPERAWHVVAPSSAMLLRSTALLPIGLACLAGVSGCGGDGLSPGGDGSGGGGGGETGGGGGARSNGVALVDWLRSMVEKASFDSVACQGAECEQPTPEGNQATSATREIAAVHAIATRRTTLQAVAGSACRVTCTPNHPATTPVGTTASHEERPVNFG